MLTQAEGQGAYGQNDLIAAASAARMQNDVPRAIKLYSEAVEKNPKWPDGWWFLGSLQYGTGAFTSARDALSHYIEMIPTAGPAFALRGLCEFETGDYRQSLADIQQGISLGAANQERNEQILRYHEALLLTRLGNYAAALKRYSFFVKNGVKSPELIAAIGLAGLRMPLLPKDVAADQQELVAAAGDAAYQYMAGDEASAGQAFQQLFQHFPKTRNAHFLYGYLLFATNPDAALEQFQDELKVSPSNADADVMAAWAFLLHNAAAEALPYAQKAVDAEPSLPSAQLVLGKSQMDTGALQSGLEHLEIALQLDPDNLETHLALAKAYSKSGRKEDARRERLLCLRLTSSHGTTTENP
ncbi:MAG TPA: tetratricopeptide repeat protein [Verrucomicrobiae bacterium]|nr:tetratricopeptide repeat protein [Verrucomicrobiae bacterium]